MLILKSIPVKKSTTTTTNMKKRREQSEVLQGSKFAKIFLFQEYSLSALRQLYRLNYDTP